MRQRPTHLLSLLLCAWLVGGATACTVERSAGGDGAVDGGRTAAEAMGRDDGGPPANAAMSTGSAVSDVPVDVPAARGQGAPDGGRGPLGEVAVGDPVVDSATGAATPLPTHAELVELSGALAMPVDGVSVDELHHAFTEARGERVHQALDILAPRGTPVRSAADGRLLKLFDSRVGGLMVYASDPSDRFILLYGHLDGYAPGLREGAPLRRGQLLGYVGTTGNAAEETPHLHFGIQRATDVARWWRGTPVDPYPLLGGR